MRKLKLDVSALRVESFDTRSQPGQEHGTVHGHLNRVEPRPDTYRDSECLGTPGTWIFTCQASCYNTCKSCYNTCDSCGPMICIEA